MKRFLKNLSLILMGLFVTAGLTFAVVQQRTNSTYELSQKRILFTDTGKTTGTKIMDINTGGKVIVYGEFTDGSGNAFSTGSFNTGLLAPYLLMENVSGKGYTGEFIYYTGGGEGRPTIKRNNGSVYGVQLSNIGLAYIADYSGSYNDRSLIDKGYADAIYSTGETLRTRNGSTMTNIVTGMVYTQDGITATGQIRANSFIAGGTYALPSGIGNYVAMYYSNSYDIARILGFDGTSYKKIAIGPYIPSVGFSQIIDLSGNVNFGIGNVGIGISSITGIASEKLEVFGTGLFHGNIRLSGAYNIYDGAGNAYSTGSVQTTGIIIDPGQAGVIPDTKAVVDYISGFAHDIGPGLAQSGYYITGYSTYGRIWMSGGLVSLQTLTGGNRTEQSYLPTSRLATSFTRPGSDNYIPTSKAVVDYIDLASQNLGDVITTGYYYISGAVQWRIGLSGNNLSFQAYTGGVWAEKTFMTP